MLLRMSMKTIQDRLEFWVYAIAALLVFATIAGAFHLHFGS